MSNCENFGSYLINSAVGGVARILKGGVLYRRIGARELHISVTSSIKCRRSPYRLLRRYRNHPPEINGRILRYKAGVAHCDAAGRAGNPIAPLCAISDCLIYPRATAIGLGAMPLEPRSILHIYKIDFGVMYCRHSAWAYGEMGGLLDVTPPISTPAPPVGCNFLDPLSIKEWADAMDDAPFGLVRNIEGGEICKACVILSTRIPILLYLLINRLRGSRCR